MYNLARHLSCSTNSDRATNRNYFSFVVLFFVGFLLFTLEAKSAAPDAGELLRLEQELERLREIPQTIPTPKEAPKPITPVQPQGPSVVVKRFEIIGDVKSISRESLDAILNPYLGKSVNFSELTEIVERITQLYRSKGYFLARAVLPAQDVTEGVIRIQILEAPLDPKNGVEFKSESMRLSRDFAKSVIESAIGTEGAIDEKLLERGILNLNDNPVFSASAAIEPGETPGTTKLVFEATEGPLTTAAVTVDNYGSRYTGEWRYTGNLNINNPTGYGDKLDFMYTGVFEGDFKLGRIGYAFPIGADGLRGSVSYTDLTFGVGKELSNLNSKGSAQNTTVGLKYPFHRTQALAINGIGSYDWKASKNESEGAVTSDKRVEVGALGLSVEKVDQLFGGGFTLLSLTRSWGDLDLSRVQASLDQDAGSGQTQGSFSKTSYQIVRIQRGTNLLSFQAILAGQRANKNLDGSEEFSLGGPAGVKAYPGGEGSGDEGDKIHLEARYTAASGTKLGDVLLQLFYDRGRVKRNKDPSVFDSPEDPNTYYLTSWGLGLNLIAAGKHDLKIGWSKAIGSNPGKTGGNNSDGKSNRSRFWVYLNKEF